ncbi:MAG: peptidylprolyl isomerase [Phycisphaerales bacterium]|nr:peptidylprolyl isomerase [Phycisphaerales bacterium]
MKFGSPRFWTLRLVIAGLPFLPACGGVGEHRFNDQENNSPAAPPTAKSGGEATPSRADERPIATVAGEAVYADDLYAWMSELAGGTVLEELAVSRQVEKELATRSLKLEASDIDAERRNMAVGTDHKLTDAELAVALRRVQQARGLGPSRFKALIERNAGLRRLVRDEVQIGEADVRGEIDLKYGPRTRVRIIVTPNESDAIAARARLDATTAADRSKRFAEEAALVSFDPSASRGGEIEPLSTADPNYALSVRQAMTNLAPGELSPIIRLENGYALLLCEGFVAAVTPPTGAEELARTRVRLREERVAMERLARKFLQSAQVTVFDRTLDWSWNARRGEGR